MALPSGKPSITEFRNLSDSDKTYLIWQGLTDTWTKLESLNSRQDGIDADTKVHHKLLITGDDGEPALMERMRNVETFIKNFGYWGRLIIGGLILQTMAFVFGIVIALIRFLPVLEEIAKGQNP